MINTDVSGINVLVSMCLLPLFSIFKRAISRSEFRSKFPTLDAHYSKLEPSYSLAARQTLFNFAPRRNETARNISPAPPPPLSGRLGIILGEHPRVCLAHFRGCTDFSSPSASLPQTVESGRRVREDLINVPQIYTIRA